MRWSWLGRPRWLAVLVGVLLLLVLFSPDIQRRPLLLIEQPILLLESWLQRLTGTATTVVGQFFENYVAVGDLAENNRRLRRDNANLRGEIVRLQEQHRFSARVEQLLAVQPAIMNGAIVAEVIGRDPTNWHESLLINRGERDGVQTDMSVIVPDGVVGRVVNVMPRTATVLLLSDRNSVIAGLTQHSRDEGLIEGIGDGQLRMKYLSNVADVQIDDVVLTSGLAGIFPKGLPIGAVSQVERPAGSVMQHVILQPAIDLSKVEEVLVLSRRQEPQP